MNRRILFLIVCFTAAYGALLFHLSGLQLANGDYYLARAESQYFSSGVLKAERGTIYFTDKNGRQVAVVSNKDLPLVYAVPKVIEDPLETANQLAFMLERPAEDILRQLSKRNDAYELLVRKAGSDVARKVEDVKIKGVYVESVPERFYPFGSLAAHLLGFVGPNEADAGESGHYGVEELHNETLSGLPGEARGNKIIAPKPGEDLTLTIDPNIQIEAERILGDLMQTSGARGGSVIVEEPKTGKILAMGSYPRFDPNNYNKTAIGDFLNPVVQQIYEPGSVLKVITMAAGIDAGKITPETTFVDSGTFTVSGKKIQNWGLKAYGRVTMTTVIEKSINTGAAFAEQQIGHDTFRKYIEKFGFGEKTGVDLPGELKGDLRQLVPYAPPVAFATASFGQGIAVTQLGLINAVAAIANGGTLMRPYVNAALEPQSIRTAIRPETARQVTEMMVSAVDKAGVANISGYSIAGKTGTAQVPDFRNGGYTDKVIHTYVGFGPTADPRFIVLLKLNEPSSAPLAGLTVVPAFRDLAQFILNYYNVSPDRIQQ